MATVAVGRGSFRRTTANAPAGGMASVESGLLVADLSDASRRAHEESGSVSLATTGGQEERSHAGAEPVERLQVSPGAVAREDGTPASLQVGERPGCDFPETDVTPGMEKRCSTT